MLGITKVRRGLGMVLSSSSQVCLSGKHKLLCVQRVALANVSDCLGLLNSGGGAVLLLVGGDVLPLAGVVGGVRGLYAEGVSASLDLPSPTRLLSSEGPVDALTLVWLVFNNSAFDCLARSKGEEMGSEAGTLILALVLVLEGRGSIKNPKSMSGLEGDSDRSNEFSFSLRGGGEGGLCSGGTCGTSITLVSGSSTWSGCSTLRGF